jgi:hypothetical protein
MPHSLGQLVMCMSQIECETTDETCFLYCILKVNRSLQFAFMTLTENPQSS